jgi:hypothetical protein
MGLVDLIGDQRHNPWGRRNLTAHLRYGQVVFFLFATIFAPSGITVLTYRTLFTLQSFWLKVTKNFLNNSLVIYAIIISFLLQAQNNNSFLSPFTTGRPPMRPPIKDLILNHPPLVASK